MPARNTESGGHKLAHEDNRRYRRMALGVGAATLLFGAVSLAANILSEPQSNPHPTGGPKTEAPARPMQHTVKELGDTNVVSRDRGQTIEFTGQLVLRPGEVVYGTYRATASDSAPVTLGYERDITELPNPDGIDMARRGSIVCNNPKVTFDRSDFPDMVSCGN